MLSAKDGSHPEVHTTAANQWFHSIAKRTGANALPLPEPFVFGVPTLVEKDYRLYVANNYGAGRRPTDTHAVTLADARPNCISALLGTAKWRREDKEEQIKKTLNIVDFKTGAGGIAKANRLTRDTQLAQQCCGFLHQAFRARGKANYRDALYFGYGDINRPALTQLLLDVELVLEKFLLVASAYSFKKVRPASRNSFNQDVQSNCWSGAGINDFFSRAL